MKKLIALLAFHLGLICSVMAEDINALTLWLASGKQVTCLLNEQPVVTFQGDDLVLTTHMNVMNYAAKDVLKFTYSYADPVAVTNLKSNESCFYFEGDALKANNIEPRSVVEVYTIDGILLSKAKADGKGNVSVSLPASYSGIYVIKTSVANFKLRRL